MYILSQILTFEGKNLIIDSLIKELKIKLSDFLNQFMSGFFINRYELFILNLQELFIDEIKTLILNIIKVLDNLYKNSEERKKMYYINVSNKPRTIYTIFGEINFERTYYRHKTDGSYYCFIDDVLGLEKYNMYDPIIRSIAIDDAVNYNPNNASYHSSLRICNLLDSLNNTLPQISRQSIYRWLREAKTSTIHYEPINNGKTIYIMADEKWIHKQDKTDKENKKKCIMSKCFVVFTHIKKKGKRHTLKGKHTFITTGKQPYVELMNEICKIYDFEKIETINLLSDAGNWILAGKEELKLYSHNKVVVNTCEFHVKQKINRSTTNKELREKLNKLIYEDEDKEGFKKCMEDIISSKDKQSRKEKITEYMNYILKHWSGIIAMKYSVCKSSMESHISHCVASKFGSRPKGYSDKNIQTYLKLQEASLNGINIMDYYLKSIYSDDSFIYNEKEAEYSLLDYSTSNVPILYTSNHIVPTLRRLIG